MIRANIYTQKHLAKSLARRVVKQYRIAEPKIDDVGNDIIISGTCDKSKEKALIRIIGPYG